MKQKPKCIHKIFNQDLKVKSSFHAVSTRGVSLCFISRSSKKALGIRREVAGANKHI